MKTYLDETGYNTYGTGNQYPEVGYWILSGPIPKFESWYPSWILKNNKFHTLP
jgi:hypothetical protein